MLLEAKKKSDKSKIILAINNCIAVFLASEKQVQSKDENENAFCTAFSKITSKEIKTLIGPFIFFGTLQTKSNFPTAFKPF